MINTNTNNGPAPLACAPQPRAELPRPPLLQPIFIHVPVSYPPPSPPTTCEPHAEPAAVCGDSVRAGAEGCDDGGRAAGDGCSASCEVEPGYW